MRKIRISYQINGAEKKLIAIMDDDLSRPYPNCGKIGLLQQATEVGHEEDLFWVYFDNDNVCAYFERPIIPHHLYIWTDNGNVCVPFAVEEL